MTLGVAGRCEGLEVCAGTVPLWYFPWAVRRVPFVGVGLSVLGAALRPAAGWPRKSGRCGASVYAAGPAPYGFARLSAGSLQAARVPKIAGLARSPDPHRPR